MQTKIMKKKYIILPLVASLFAFTACDDDYNEDNFPGLEDSSLPTNVFTKEYTLTEADYATIASNSTNKKIASEKGLANELAALKTTQAFTDQLKAEDYLPAFIATKWYSGDNGSAVKVTYNKKPAVSATETALNAATIYEVTDADYETAWGKSGVAYFTPQVSASKHLPDILAAAKSDAKEGDVVFVDYSYSDQEPSDGTDTPQGVTEIDQNFEGLWDAATNTPEIEGWHNVAVTGTYHWAGKIYSGNAYVQQSAYKHNGALQSYLITPQLTVKAGMHLTFDACYGNYTEKGGRLTLLYTTDELKAFDKAELGAAKWTDITSSVSIPVPTTTYGTLANVCDYDLSALAGKKIYIAFRYDGDGSTGATTTIQVDNVKAKAVSAVAFASTRAASATTPLTALYRYDGSKWAVLKDAVSLNKGDFQAMGSNYDNFSSSMLPANYLPAYLKVTFPYAQENAQKTVAYKFYNSSSKSTVVQSSTYSYVAGTWNDASAPVATTDQFVLNKGNWNYDPSVTIALPVERGNTTVAAFYQAITDWVKENNPTYVTSYGNNDYYYGGSAYQNNFDFRTSAWQSYYPDKSAADIEKIMWQRLPESFPHALEALYPNAAPVDGIDVYYTISSFGIYTGTTAYYTIKYKVVSKGKFEYVKDSLQPIQ